MLRQPLDAGRTGGQATHMGLQIDIAAIVANHAALAALAERHGVAELALAARTVAGAYSRYWEPYLAISAVYLVLTLTLSMLAKRLEAPEHLRGR